MPKIQMRRDTAANWKSVNPILLAGEWALETDTRLMKIGDGSTAYNALPYSTAEDSDEWQKPSDWIDIRSGACPNSIYYLVGHSADYSTYPQFSVYAEIQNSGTYDVFVDGVKQATTASGTETVLTWQTLALETGYDTTYPSALKTHIVRVTPSASTNKFTNIRANNATGYDELVHGVLWVHFSIDYAIKIERFLGSAYKTIAPILEAVTAYNDTLFLTGYANQAFRYSKLKKLTAALDCSGPGVALQGTFMDCTQLKGTVTIKNFSPSLPLTNYNRIFQRAKSVERIILDGGYIPHLFYVYDECEKLKEIRGMIPNNTSGLEQIYWTKNYAYENPTLLDLSPNSICIKCDLQQNPWLKGLTVSNEAPFTGASPQLNVSYTGLDRAALVNLFNSLPTVIASQVCNVTGATGASDLTASDLAIATAKGWTVTR